MSAQPPVAGCSAVSWASSTLSRDSRSALAVKRWAGPSQGAVQCRWAPGGGTFSGGWQCLCSLVPIQWQFNLPTTPLSTLSPFNRPGYWHPEREQACPSPRKSRVVPRPEPPSCTQNRALCGAPRGREGHLAGGLLQPRSLRLDSRTGGCPEIGSRETVTPLLGGLPSAQEERQGSRDKERRMKRLTPRQEGEAPAGRASCSGHPGQHSLPSPAWPLATACPWSSLQPGWHASSHYFPSLQQTEQQISRIRGQEGQIPGTGEQEGGLSRRKHPAVHTVLSCPHNHQGRPNWDDPGHSKAHRTYLCVGGLLQWVVAIPDDRYRSLRRSMRRTFTKSLGRED